jgi:hypothetical protein
MAYSGCCPVYWTAMGSMKAPLVAQGPSAFPGAHNQVSARLRLGHVPDRRKPISLRSPSWAQAQGVLSLYPRRTHAFDPWGLRATRPRFARSGP